MNCSEQALGFSSLKVAKRETNKENVELKYISYLVLVPFYLGAFAKFNKCKKGDF